MFCPKPLIITDFSINPTLTVNLKYQIDYQQIKSGNIIVGVLQENVSHYYNIS